MTKLDWTNLTSHIPYRADGQKTSLQPRLQPAHQFELLYIWTLPNSG